MFLTYDRHVLFFYMFFMYINPRDMSAEEKTKKRRQLNMQQMSYQSDLKKVHREQDELKDERRRLEQDRSRINVYITENDEKMKKSVEQETYFEEELRRIKKQLIELG